MNNRCAILSVIFLLGCGKVDHKVRGNTTHTIKLDLIEFEEVFRNECEENFQDADEIDACVNEKISELIEIININLEDEEL